MYREKYATRYRSKRRVLASFHEDASRHFLHPLSEDHDKAKEESERANALTDRVNTLLERLPEDQALILKHYFRLSGCERLTLQQIADKLGITASTVARRKKKALEALQAIA